MASRPKPGDGNQQARDDARHQRTISFRFCSKHGQRYPEGERCALCQAEDRQPKKSKP